jgi:hypothetical protein
MTTGQIDRTPTPLPLTWASSAEGRFCLVCRRERAANAAVESAPSDDRLDVRARVRRTGLIEFEIRRTPDQSDGAIAKACRTSVSVVAEARSRLQLSDAPAIAARARSATAA